MSSFLKFFRNEADADLEQSFAEAQEIVAWAQAPYTKVFMDWLDNEASKPFSLGEQTKMIVSGARLNTFKEIQSHLKRVTAGAENLLRQERSRDGH